jgi:hypothetical protein
LKEGTVLTIHGAAADLADAPDRREVGSRTNLLRGAGVTAAAALVAGALLLTRELPIVTLGAIAVGVGFVALLVTAAAARTWNWAAAWTGPGGHLEPLAGPAAWLAVIFATVVVMTTYLPLIVPAWSSDQVFAAAMVAFVLLTLLGWGPGVGVVRSWPSSLRLSSMAMPGTLVALALVIGYLVFVIVMRFDAVGGAVDDTEWARLVEIRSTLEALGFAAAGALLGAMLQRQATASTLSASERTIADQEQELARERESAMASAGKLAFAQRSLSRALLLLSPGAPAGLADMDSDQLERMGLRASTESVKQARRELLAGLRDTASG